LTSSNAVEQATFAETFDRPEWRARVATLVYETLSDYYDAFSRCQSDLLDSIARQLDEPASEVGRWRALVVGGEIAGIYCAYDSDEEADRRFVSLRMLMDVPEPAADCFDRLDAYRKTVGPTPKDAYYLSRIAVAPARRGAGLGRRLLENFEDAGRRHGRTLAALHVHRRNQRALDIYRAAGYEIVSPPDLSYATMTKSLSGSAR
jgi:ribosomal protein S18 acetylase RimI-like enzyme